MKLSKELVDDLFRKTMDFYETELKKVIDAEKENESKPTLSEFNELYLGKKVHCKTEALSNEFLKIAEKFGYKWMSGDKLTRYNYWKKYKENTFYKLRLDDKSVLFGDLDEVVEFKGGE